MRISDWSSDVCSSDLPSLRGPQRRSNPRPARSAPWIAAPSARNDGEEGRGSSSPLPPCSPHSPRLGREGAQAQRSEEHTSELQSLMRISYAVFCLKKKTQHNAHPSILDTSTEQANNK